MGKKNQNNTKNSKKSVENMEKKEKVMTKYDRKMEARRIQAEKEQMAARRWKIGFCWQGFVWYVSWQVLRFCLW